MRHDMHLLGNNESYGDYARRKRAARRARRRSKRNNKHNKVVRLMKRERAQLREMGLPVRQRPRLR